jgi:hypothetical protein
MIVQNRIPFITFDSMDVINETGDPNFSRASGCQQICSKVLTSCYSEQRKDTDRPAPEIRIGRFEAGETEEFYTHSSIRLTFMKVCEFVSITSSPVGLRVQEYKSRLQLEQ